MAEGARRIAPTAQLARTRVRKRRVYQIDWSREAEADFRNLPAFWQRQVTAAIAQLVHQAEIETRNRKRLSEKLGDLMEAEWNLRIGDLRVLYRIIEGRIVQILRVILKGTATTDAALRRVKS
jgi:mRNA-degrading endonuclease RelE of RelBE toxin-antitoxin system